MITAPPPTWNTLKNKPSTIAGFNITDALNVAAAFGVNQSWVDYTGSRNTGVQYQNTSGKGILVSLTGAHSSNSYSALYGYVDGAEVFRSVTNYYGPNALPFGLWMYVPNGSTYQINPTGAFSKARWTEYRA